jgi:hypothetical protein
MKFFICLLFSITVFSQSKPLELKIDSIKTTNTADDDREFIINYHITNLSDKAISFVLDTNSIIPISSGSLRKNPYYKIYENKKSFDADGIFFSKNTGRFFHSEEALKKYRDSIDAVIENKTHQQILSEIKEKFLSSIIKMASKETIKLQAKLYWAKKRYFKNDELEYYIEEKEPYYFELSINLMTEELLMNFTEEERNEIVKNKDLTKGWYTSNRVPIDFNE